MHEASSPAERLTEQYWFLPVCPIITNDYITVHVSHRPPSERLIRIRRYYSVRNNDVDGTPSTEYPFSSNRGLSSVLPLRAGDWAYIQISSLNMEFPSHLSCLRVRLGCLSPPDWRDNRSQAQQWPRLWRGAVFRGYVQPERDAIGRCATDSD